MEERTALARPALFANLAAIVGASVVTALAAQVAIDVGPVPQTLQTMAVLATGCLLGARRGAAAMALYAAEGAAGLPVFAGGAGGVAELTGASGGYVVGFVLAAAVAGAVCDLLGRRFVVSVPAMLLASVPLYACGLVWLKHAIPADWGYVVHWGLAVFVVGDVLKILAAAALLDPAAPWGRALASLRARL